MTKPQKLTAAGFAAAFAVQTPPLAAAAGAATGYVGRVRTYVTYAGTVTAAVVRLYTRLPGGTIWFRGPSTDDDTPLAPSATMLAESRDWLVGAGIECLFVLESVSPGTATNTVAVDAVGVSA